MLVSIHRNINISFQHMVRGRAKLRENNLRVTHKNTTKLNHTINKQWQRYETLDWNSCNIHLIHQACHPVM